MGRAAKRNEVRNLIEDPIAEKILHVEKEDVQTGQLVSHPEVCKLDMVEWSRHKTTQRSYEPHSPLSVTKCMKQLDVVHVGLEGRRASKVVSGENSKGGCTCFKLTAKGFTARAIMKSNKDSGAVISKRENFMSVTKKSQTHCKGWGRS